MCNIPAYKIKKLGTKKTGVSMTTEGNKKRERNERTNDNKLASAKADLV